MSGILSQNNIEVIKEEIKHVKSISQFLKRVGLIRILEEGEFKKELVRTIKVQVDNLDLGDYRLKKHRFVIEELQTLDLNIITDKVYEDLKIVSDYIEDNTKFETQRFQMEILNAEELSVKQKDNKSYIEGLQARCKILKSKANTIHTIKNKIDDRIISNLGKSIYLKC